MNGLKWQMTMAPNAAKLALDLVGRLADDIVVGTDAGDVSMLLRQARDVLSRVAVKTSETDLGVHVESSSMTLFDVSDLLGYFEHNRLPTGIQRVQSELIFNILKSNDQATRLCCFVEPRDRWVTVDTAKFMDICALSRMGGDPLEASWVAAIRELQASIGGTSGIGIPSWSYAGKYRHVMVAP